MQDRGDRSPASHKVPVTPPGATDEHKARSLVSPEQRMWPKKFREKEGVMQSNKVRRAPGEGA